FRITSYADALLEDMKELQSWPERVLAMQRNWIGKSIGARIDFKVAGPVEGKEESITVFTTRVDTIYGATAVVVAPEHPLIEKLVAGVPGGESIRNRIRELIARRPTSPSGEMEKEGLFLGRFAVNPFSGDQVPIWVANFVLMEYGTGAVMSVPAHD